MFRSSACTMRVNLIWRIHSGTVVESRYPNTESFMVKFRKHARIFRATLRVPATGKTRVLYRSTNTSKKRNTKGYKIWCIQNHLLSASKLSKSSFGFVWLSKPEWANFDYWCFFVYARLNLSIIFIKLNIENNLHSISFWGFDVSYLMTMRLSSGRLIIYLPIVRKNSLVGVQSISLERYDFAMLTTREGTKDNPFIEWSANRGLPNFAQLRLRVWFESATCLSNQTTLFKFVYTVLIKKSLRRKKTLLIQLTACFLCFLLPLSITAISWVIKTHSLMHYMFFQVILISN